MRCVAFVSPKGGAGKTTASLILALGLVERGCRVAMIDADPNKPLVQWRKLPNPPGKLSVHAAPTVQDIADAHREARRREPDWLILDTEGSLRGAMASAAVRPELTITPLAGSPLEAVQAIKAAELVAAGRRSRHRCLLTRIPAALRTRGLKMVVQQLQHHRIEILPTALLEKEAFRALFSYGGGFATLAAEGVSGIEAARRNAENYVQAVVDVVCCSPDVSRHAAGA